jgi:hypothetical protein
MLPGDARAISAVHALRFAADDEHIYAIDNLGRLMLLDRKRRVTNWIVQGVSAEREFAKLHRQPDPQTASRIIATQGLFVTRACSGLFQSLEEGFTQSTLRLRALRHYLPGPPRPWDRIGSNVLVLSDGQLVTAGEDMVIKVWDGTLDDGRTRFQVGPNPRMSFDLSDPHLLWAATSDGNVHVINTLNSQEVDVKQAHAGKATALAIVNGALGMNATIAVTAGSDHMVRFWAFRDGKIHSAGEIEHQRPLLSVTASHDGRWIAAVDDAGTLSVWDSASAGVVHRTALPAAGGVKIPTGKVAFNCDDSMLAAFGVGQSCAVFATPSFGRLENRPPRIAGDGGTALLWHPIDPTFLVAVIENIAAHAACVAAVSTPDRRRWVWLEQDGRIVVCDPSQSGVLIERRSAEAEACDLAIDPNGYRVAVAHVSGLVEILETRPRDSVSPQRVVDDRRSWTSSPLIASANGVFEPTPRGIAIDSHDRLCLLAVEKNKSSDPEGSVVFLREDERKPLLEQVSTNGRVPVDSVFLALDERAEPIAVFRQGVGAQTAYVARLVIKRRVSPQQWDEEEVIDQMNAGGYPFVVTREGNVQDILHFDYYSHLWRRTYRVGSSWEHGALGFTGDGQHLQSCVGPDASYHFIFRTNRFNSDPGAPIYANWDGKRLVREVVDPGGLNLRIQVTSEGIPLVLLRRPGPGGSHSYVVGRRTSRERWKYEAEPVPPVGCDVGDFACGPDGEMYVVTFYDEEARRLVMWRQSLGAWHVEVVADEWESDPDWCMVRVDSQGQPVIVVGRSGENSWVRVFRRTSAR